MQQRGLFYQIWRLENSEDKKSWEPIVSQFRKLREGVYASEWSRGNYDFAIQGNRDWQSQITAY